MIDFINVSKSYPPHDILKEANFRINSGEKVGVVGPNGAGKTTLFGLISGELLPDKGSVSRTLSARIAYLKQQLPETFKKSSLLDYVSCAIPEIEHLNLQISEIQEQMASSVEPTKARLRELGELQSRYEAIGAYSVRARASIILGGLGFPEARFKDDISSFSGGWQMRAGLARVLLAAPEIMLLDEPSNYLDMPAIEWLQRFLGNFRGTMLLVSHDRYLLRKLTSVTIEIAGGMASRYSGGYDFYERERAQRFKSLTAAKINQERRIEQIERFVDRFRAKNTKASQVKSRLKTLEKMPEIRIPASRNNTPLRLPEAPHSGAEIFRLDDASTGYGEKKFILENISIQVMRGQKIAITGYNGTGKTTLLRLMAGELPLLSGKRVVGHKVVIGYQAQDFSDNMPPEQSLHDIVRSAAAPASATKDIRGILGAFGFSGDDASKLCRHLSGGEKIRLAFARIFANPPNFLILDEPTTHLDISTREALQNELRKYKGTVCMVSHDIEFVRKTAGQIIAMEPPGIKLYYGDYDYYLDKSGFTEKEPSMKKKGVSEDDPRLLRKKRAEMRQSAREARSAIESEIHHIEKKIDKLEEEKARIVASIENPAEGLDFYGVNKRLVEIEETLNTLSSKWDEKTNRLQVIIEEQKLKYQEI